MMRTFLWFILIFIVWKIARLFSSHAGRSRYTEDTTQPFSNIQDAEFEDLSKKSPPPDSTSSKQDH